MAAMDHMYFVMNGYMLHDCNKATIVCFVIAMNE